jgi:hypothetical protein
VRNIYTQLKIRDFLYVSNHRQHAEVLSSIPRKSRPSCWVPMLALFTIAWCILLWVIYGTSLGIQYTRRNEVQWSMIRRDCANISTLATNTSCLSWVHYSLLYGNSSISLPGSLNRYAPQDELLNQCNTSTPCLPLTPLIEWVTINAPIDPQNTTIIIDTVLIPLLDQSTNLYIEEAQFDSYVMLNVLLFIFALSIALFAYCYYGHVIAIVHMLHSESFVSKCMLLVLPNSVIMSTRVRNFLIDNAPQPEHIKDHSPELQNVIDSCIDVAIIYEYRRFQGRIITHANRAATTTSRTDLANRPLAFLFPNITLIEQAEENCRQKSVRQTITTIMRCNGRDFDVSISMGPARTTDSNSFIIFARQTDVLLRDAIEQDQRAQIKQLIYHNIPPSLVQRLQNGVNTASQTHHWVTVIVIRLHEFDAFVNYKGDTNTMTPKKMIEALQCIHIALDELSAQYHIRKLHTHGLDYVCCSDVFSDQETANSENSTIESIGNLQSLI